ncbi:neurofilament medium polypeptide-like [Ananas comosus]|uniref:Neurofilament medium polypeptide-like n=1 Tax=Ananas comosus TaxID=4615 RepID=A0A6P5G662_ANACO|nr:neurofilament medium polypeptide-like [Ananas comosus]
MRDQEQGMEKVSGGGRRRKGGLSIPMTGCCGVGVAILVFAAAAAAVGASVVARARRARREDQATKRSFAEDVDNERIEGAKVEEEVEEEEENGSIVSQGREKMREETEEISFQIDQENQSIGKLDLSPRREDTEIVAATEEEEIILKPGNDGDYDRESSEESKATPTEVKVSEEANDEKEGDEKEEEEDSTENEKAECDLSSSVEFRATTEPSTEEAVDGPNNNSRACLTESGVFEAIENTSKTEENDSSAKKKREVEWKLEDDVNKDPRGEPKKIEIRNTTKTIAIEENEIGFAIANRSKGGLLMISAFVLAIVLLLFVRRDRPDVLELSTM